MDNASLIIIDDEYTIRQGLSTIIPWSDHGVSLTGVFGDPREALTHIREHGADFVISDIRMPHITGLRLLEEVNQLSSKSIFMFLSGYDEFSYAKTALNLGAFAYLLKPIDISELTETLHRAKRHLEELRAHPFPPAPQTEENSDPLASPKESMIQQAKTYMAENFSDTQLSLTQITRHIGINSSYFSTLFAQHEKVGVIDYLTRLRIEHAKKLLLHTHDMVYTIAEQCGYANTTYFCTLFKRHTGMTPGEFRTRTS